jgi:hypothetical protein
MLLVREKNILRAAQALFASQGDDKNKVLASFIDNKDVRKRVQDQGRALLILERLCLPQGKFSYSIEEVHSALLTKLEKKGHRIQKDDAEDDEQYAEEKERFTKERLEMVGDVLGKTLADVAACGEKAPIYGYSCVLDKGHDEYHETSGGVRWENKQQEEPEIELTEEERQELEEALETQKRLLDDLPEVDEVEDSHTHRFPQDLPYGMNPGDHTQRLDGQTPNQGEVISEAAWNLIGQAYIDGVRAGIVQNS